MNNEHCIQFDEVRVDLLELKVWVKDKHIHFTLTELRLLLLFLSEPQRTFSREELIRRADITSVSALHVLIARLRVLLDQRYIFTVRHGLGYSFAKVPGARRNQILIRSVPWIGN